MKHITFRLFLAFLTFTIGISFTAFWMFRSEISDLHISQIQNLPNTNPTIDKNQTTEDVAGNVFKFNDIDNDDKPPIKIIGRGELCEEHYLLKKIAREKNKVSRIVELKTFKTEGETYSPELEKWFETIHRDELVTFELRHKQGKGLIFRANVAGATGIAANFNNWHIQDSKHSITFRSLSDNPNLIFIDEAGLLNYYSIDYGYTFLANIRDWNNLTLDLKRYRINDDGESQLVDEELNVKCK